MTKIERKIQHLKKLPPANTLVELAMVVKDDSKVTSQNINRLRQTCNDIADLVAETYYKDSFSSILRKFKNKPLSNNANFSQLLNALVKESPKIVVSMANSRMGIGGRANEILYRNLLKGVGLIFGRDFKKVSGRGKDLEIVSRKTGNKLLVEIKSLKVRERGARTGADRKVRAVLAGFFDEPREFGVEQVKEMGRVYEAAYLPPTTLKRINEQSKKIKNAENKPLLRSNKLFAKEIKKFVLSGEAL